MFKNLARGLSAAMPAAVAATLLTKASLRLDLGTVRRVCCSHTRVAP